jgi:hypothetical protein
MKRGIYAALIGLVLLGVYWFLHRWDTKKDNEIATPTLKADEKQKYVIDQKRHTVTYVDGTGSKKTFINSHGPVSVIEKKDGKTVLIQRTWGTEHEPYGGFTFGSDIRLRAALGLSLFYVQRWELGGGLLMSNDIHDTRVYLGCTYNVYNNILVGLTIDSRKTASLIAALRF